MKKKAKMKRRKCKECKTLFPMNQFQRHRHGGRIKVCKDCMVKKSKRGRKATEEKEKVGLKRNGNLRAGELIEVIKEIIKADSIREVRKLARTVIGREPTYENLQQPEHHDGFNDFPTGVAAGAAAVELSAHWADCLSGSNECICSYMGDLREVESLLRAWAYYVRLEFCHCESSDD